MGNIIVNIFCEDCKKIHTLFLDSKLFHTYLKGGDPKELFKDLSNNEILLLSTGKCEKCTNEKLYNNQNLFSIAI